MNADNIYKNVDILDSVKRIKLKLYKYIKPTPLVASSFGWLKMELWQPTNSFKVRPAFCSVLMHLDECRARGVVTSSSGNFAQALAYVAHALGIKATIVMTADASPYKMQKTRDWGADVVMSGPSFEERWAKTAEMREKTQSFFVHPYDSVETVIGDGTCGYEIAQQLGGELDNAVVLVPTSGGGLLSGVATVLKKMSRSVVVIGVQPSGNGSLRLAFEAKEPRPTAKVDTIADALVAKTIGDVPCHYILENVDAVLEVSDHSMRLAMAAILNEKRLVVEPGGAAAVAASAIEYKEWLSKTYPGRSIVNVLSGGNISLERFSELVTNI